ncbi:hypothetical protein H9Q09_00615 [Aurantimonas sp. DM33-3]|uniref:hypothetical protein n=1 Tax=Aurantimonas sp. DM33-3 TaxID=2766955 RepID=UPI001651CF2E|nr:hypothetical protein [Aurantimonas sp. DM33-3]MBC6714687.1 hypothetical protein [Aurantimonas sp. DM33-3]
MAESVEERLERIEKFMALQMEASKAIADQLQAIVSAMNAIVRVTGDGDLHNALEETISSARGMEASAEVIQTLNTIAER